eukprot:COSAG05_NODE_16594_length_342_cov_1.053498_2_plen_71_part_01
MFLSAEIAAVFVLSAQNRVELEETRKIEMSRKEAAGLARAKFVHVILLVPALLLAVKLRASGKWTTAGFIS